MMKTYSVKADDIHREWHTIDASGEILGKIATRAANLLMGKHKPLFSRHADVGDFVVITNASKVQFTGKKGAQKMYYRHSGYPGGLKSISLEKLMASRPERVIEHAVRGMLPTNRLRAKMMKRLRVFAGDSQALKAKPGSKKPAQTEKPATE